MMSTNNKMIEERLDVEEPQRKKAKQANSTPENNAEKEVEKMDQKNDVGTLEDKFEPDEDNNDDSVIFIGEIIRSTTSNSTPAIGVTASIKEVEKKDQEDELEDKKTTDEAEDNVEKPKING